MLNNLADSVVLDVIWRLIISQSGCTDVQTQKEQMEQNKQR